MIRSTEIANFRCFEKVSLKKCKRVNVVVGRNGSGKTALLEALFLAIGPSPEIATRYRTWRGFEPSLAGTFEEIEEAIWGDLFFRYEQNKKIIINIKGSGQHKRSLIITWGESEPILPVGGKQQALHGLSAIEFKWVQSDGTKSVVRPEFTGTGYLFPGAESHAVPATFFTASHPFINPENVKRFSKLAKTNDEGPVVEALEREFGFIEGLDILSHAGVPMLHAKVKGMRAKVPLNLISSGVIKLTTLLLAIAETKNNILFIDEIENNFHYTKFSSVWSALYKFSCENDVQIFASTHSQECLEGLASACHKNADDVSVIRTDLEDGASTVKQFWGEPIFTAIKRGEIR